MSPPPASRWCSAASPQRGPLPHTCTGWRGTARTRTGAWHPDLVGCELLAPACEGEPPAGQPCPCRSTCSPMGTADEGDDFLCPVIFRVHRSSLHEMATVLNQPANGDRGQQGICSGHQWKHRAQDFYNFAISRNRLKFTPQAEICQGTQTINVYGK